MADIHFGTDGWRAIIGEDFTVESVVQVVSAAARTFRDMAVEGYAPDAVDAAVAVAKDGTSQAMAAEGAIDYIRENPGVLYVGHDCRQDAHAYALLAATVAAQYGFEVKLTQQYCPTPALCWSVSQDDDAVGGIMLTSSHNPAEYLGVKLRMADGGASPKSFTDIVEDVMDADSKGASTGAIEDGAISALTKLTIEDIRFALAQGAPLTSLTGIQTGQAKQVQLADFMTPYLDALSKLVDVEAIKQAGLSVVVDPLYGAGRGYLADLLRSMGVEVEEIHNETDPTFKGLHPEPIPPWIDEGLEEVAKLGFDALFINDGDADRIGAGDSKGNFVNPHRIITLVTRHLAARGEKGRVVSTVTASALLDRACRQLGIELVSTPVGFKWIYEEMEKGGVMVGGEESGGIGIPEHVKERDGLLMALLLCEMMAQSGKDLGTLVAEMLEELGTLEFARRGLSISDEQMKNFREQVVANLAPESVCGSKVIEVDRRDGVKLLLEGDAWVMMRPSGTEPLVRIYAEAETTDEVEKLLDWAEEAVVA